jgi:hypothetical protein
MTKQPWIEIAGAFLMLVAWMPGAVSAAVIISDTSYFHSDGSTTRVIEWDTGQNEYMEIDEEGTITDYFITTGGNPNPEGDGGGGTTKEDVPDMANHLKLTGGGEDLEQEFDNTGLGRFLKQVVDGQSNTLVHVYRPSEIANVFNPGGASQGGDGESGGSDKDGLKKKPGEGLEEVLDELKRQLAAGGGGFDVEAGTLREQILLALNKEAGQAVEMEFQDSDDADTIDVEAVVPEGEEQVGPPELVNPDPTRTATVGGDDSADPLDQLDAFGDLPDAPALDTSSASPAGQAGQAPQQPAAASGTPAASTSPGGTTRTQEGTSER